jgi:FAD:protein FMN transferase
MTSPSNSIRRARPLLGTLVEIWADASAGAGALEAAFAAVAKVHQLMSAQDATSDVGRINRAVPGEAVPIHPWTRQVLLRAREIAEATGGLFDCYAADPEKLTLDGIAKGFAVDQAVTVLRAAGVPWGTVNAGGDLRVFGAAPEPVHIRDAAGGLLSIGMLREEAIATSSSASIVDPRNGRSVTTGATVSVIAPDCMTADALTKVVLLLDPAGARRVFSRLDARALVIDPLRSAA